MSIALIAAIAQNNCIGRNNDLPWYIPEDLKHFKDMTVGKVVLMGRKTWESTPEKYRPLPQRLNVVITRQAEYPLPEGVERFASVEAGLAAHQGDEVMIIGGAEIYRETMGIADTLYITHIHQTVDGDAFFPPIDLAIWHETEREDHERFSFVTYKRI